MAARKRKKTVRVNFKDAKSNRIPEGAYPAKVVGAEIKSSKQSGEDYVEWKFEVLSGDCEGRVAYFNNSLQPQALWRLRETLEALGVEVPDGAMDIDPDEYVGCEAEISVIESEYEGKRQSKIDDVLPLSKKGRRKVKDEDDAPKTRRKVKDEDDDEPKGRKGKKSKSAEIERASVEDMDEDELSDLVDEHELDVDLERLKTRKKKAAAVIDALEDAGLLAEDEDEDEDDD
jgi:hypothetical protein